MMTQYKDRIELQRQILLAEQYINNIKDIHAHSLTSMWYENNQTAKDAVKGVVDITYMDGRIERTINETGRQYTIVEGRIGEALVQEVTRNLADSGKQLV